MSNIIAFTQPFAPLEDATKNLQALVEWSKPFVPNIFIKCGNIRGKQKPFQWHDEVWDLGATLKRGRGSFRNVRWKPISERYSSKGAVEETYAGEFADFARAIFVKRYIYQSDLSASPYKNLLTALGVLWSSLKEHDNHERPLHQISEGDFDRAAEYLKKRITKEARRSQVGGCLQMISEFLNDEENNLVTCGFRWKNPHKYHTYRNFAQRDAEAIRAQTGKKLDSGLPHPEDLIAIATAFHKATDPIDVLVTSILALLCCHPKRSAEIETVPENCVVIGRDSRARVIWHPAKGGPSGPKCIPMKMQNVFLKAVENLRRVCEPGREVARWYEKNPTSLFLPKELEYLRESPEEWRIIKDFAPLLQLKNNRFQSWLLGDAQSELKARCKKGGSANNGEPRWLMRFCDFEQFMLSNYLPLDKLKKDFHQNTYSERLIVLLKYQTDGEVNPWPLMVQEVSVDALFMQLYPYEGKEMKGWRPSIFERLGIRRKDGSPIRLRSHQVRHWLNSIIRRDIMSEEMIAAWSGRKNSEQNAAYDHVSPEVKMEEFEMVLVTPEMKQLHRPVSDQEYMALADLGPSHSTPFGICTQSLSIQGCTKHAQCMTCEMHCIFKGIDTEKEEYIIMCYENEKKNLAHINKAIAEGHRTAGKKHAHAVASLRYWEQQIDALRSKTIPIGTPIMIQKSDGMSSSFGDLYLGIRNAMLEDAKSAEKS